VLVHSPLVGHWTWQPVADHLAADGYAVAVPDLAGVLSGEPPYHPPLAQAIAGRAAGQPVILIGHGRAGPLLAAPGTMLAADLRGCIFVGARLPEPARRPGCRRGLNGGATGNWPRCSPTRPARRQFAAGCPRLPIAMLEEAIRPRQDGPALPAAT
jgi:hypothetical protein